MCLLHCPDLCGGFPYTGPVRPRCAALWTPSVSCPVAVSPSAPVPMGPAEPGAARPRGSGWLLTGLVPPAPRCAEGPRPRCSAGRAGHGARAGDAGWGEGLFAAEGLARGEAQASKCCEPQLSWPALRCVGAWGGSRCEQSSQRRPEVLLAPSPVTQSLKEVNSGSGLRLHYNQDTIIFCR